MDFSVEYDAAFSPPEEEEEMIEPDITEILRIIGINIQTARKRMMMNQATLCERIGTGITQPYLSKVERGKAVSSLLMLKRVSNALNMQFHELFIEHREKRP